MTPEDRSDDLNGRIVAVTARDYASQWRLKAVLGAILIFVVVGFTMQSVLLFRISSDTRRAVTSQIPGLQQQIRARDRTIYEQKYELGEAVDAIVKLASQVKNLGGDPGEIRVTPPPPTPP